MMVGLSVSIVTFSPNLMAFGDTLQSLGEALQRALQAGKIGRCEVILVDNGPGMQWAESLTHTLESLVERFDFIHCHLISGQGNVGYGRGHNLAIAKAKSEFHLVLNPDVIVDSEAILEALRFLGKNQEVGMLSPFADDDSGKQQFLCKRYPAVFDLLMRGLSPKWGRMLFRRRLDRYEMRECYIPEGGAPFEVPIVSGCFMFCRRATLDVVGGFSHAFFMYFEDFDLSLRMGRYAQVVCAPSVRITHFGGNAARKGWRHILMFIQSGICFYRMHGWKFL